MEVKKKMNSQELRSFQEAYLEVVYNQQQLAEELQGKARERGEQLLKKTKGKPNSFQKNSKINWLLGKSKQHPSHEYGTVSRSAEEKGQSRAPKQTKAKKGQTKKQGVKTLGGGGGNVGTYGMPQKDTLPRGKGNKAARRAGKSVEDTRKEDFEFWVHNLLDEGYDLSDYTWDEMYEFYLDEECGDYDIFDIVLEFLQVEGYAETLEEAEWVMANLIDEEAVDIILGEEQLDEVLDTPEKANEYARKNVRSMLGAFVKGVANKDISQLKTIEKRKRGAELGKRKAERKAAEEQKESFDAWLDEAMTNYEKNRKRAAQRAAARNAARDQGKTGAVPGVGYVTPRRERETWTDESGKTRHAKGL